MSKTLGTNVFEKPVASFQWERHWSHPWLVLQCLLYLLTLAL